MGQILIRKVDENVLAALRRRARDSGVSLEEEARRTLAAGVGAGLEGWLARMDAIRERIGPLPGPSSLDLLREDRTRDDEA